MGDGRGSLRSQSINQLSLRWGLRRSLRSHLAHPPTNCRGLQSSLRKRHVDGARRRERADTSHAIDRAEQPTHCQVPGAGLRHDHLPCISPVSPLHLELSGPRCWPDMGRYGEITGRCGEVWGETPLLGSQCRGSVRPRQQRRDKVLGHLWRRRPGRRRQLEPHRVPRVERERAASLLPQPVQQRRQDVA